MRLSNIASKAIGILAIVQGTASANLPELTDNSLAKRADSTSSVVDFVNGKNTGSTPVSFTNGCPCYDFTFHSQTQIPWFTTWTCCLSNGIMTIST